MIFDVIYHQDIVEESGQVKFEFGPIGPKKEAWFCL